MMFGTDPVDHRLHGTVEQFDDQHQHGHADQDHTLDPADVQQKDNRQEYRRQQNLLTKGSFMTKCRPDAVKGVHSSKSNSSDSGILLHSMTTLIHFPVCTLVKHNALKRSRGMKTWSLLTLLLFTATVPQVTLADSRAPLVALASSFRDLWPELSQLYTEQTGQQAPRTSFASSGLLSTQIRHGAPFELFLSADASTVVSLHEAGKTRDEGTVLALGALSLVSLNTNAAAENASSAPQDAGMSLLKSRLENQQAFRIAIPNPEHAPYGKAARESLQYHNTWPLPGGYLLNAENAAQTFQFALTGAVDFAIVPDTLLHKAPPGLSVWPLPAESYDPVVHTMVLLDSAGSAAEQLFSWLQGTTASAVLARHGLSPAN